MKRKVITLSVTAVVILAVSVPAFSQVVIYDDQFSEPYSAEGGVESRFLHAWNRHHDSQERWRERRDNFGPDDVIRLLEARGYRVRNVDDVGERYLVQASRGGDNLLVSVSRAGEIMGVVHSGY